VSEVPEESEDVPGTDVVRLPGHNIKLPGQEVDRAVADLVTRLVGGSMEHAVGLLTDVLGFVRFSAALKLLKAAQRQVDKAGLEQAELGPVDPSTFLPILEFGSTVGDESMQARWATLLANALATPDAVPPAFAETLRQLAPREAALLDGLVDSALADRGELGE